MKRRAFFTSLGGGAAVLAGSGCREKEPVPTKTPETARVSELPLENLLRRYKSFLFDDFLPFLDAHVIDKEMGGFLCNVDAEGNRLSTEKNTWYQGRGLWSVSFLYNHLDKSRQWLEAGRKTAEFLLKTIPPGESFWPATMTREGKPATPPPPNFYGDLFVALGLQEFAKASGEERYWKAAREILLKCLRIYDRPNYWPEAGRTIVGAPVPLIPGARIGGHWFMLLNLSTLMLEFKPDPEIVAVADRAIEAFLGHHYHPEFDLFNEVVAHDLSRPPNDIAQFVATGHSTETLWMIMAEAVRRKDESLFAKAARHFKRNLETAWDDVYGGVFMELKHVDRNEWKLDKSNWAQAESLIGLLMIVERLGEPWAVDWFEKVFAYMAGGFPLKKYGSPLWIDYADRKLGLDISKYARAEVLHHPRHLMMNILALERMAS